MRGVTKQYPGAPQPAVDRIDLDIAPGEFVVLLGPSGCGKTTLLKMINRIYEPSAGTISIDGADVQSMNRESLRRGIGYVIQQTGLFPHMTIAANVAVVPKLLKWNRQRIAERVTELLDLVGLPPDSYAKRYPSQLSGGEQQRVGIARALAASPPTMLMDEPFGALDAITRTRLQDELRAIHQRISQTIIFVTHDIDEAVRLADRIVIIRDGKVEQVGTPLDIVRDPASDFIAELVGSHDMLRLLSLMHVGDALVPTATPGGQLPTVERDTTLRTAISTLMETGAPAVHVLDERQEVMGEVTMESIQRLAQTGREA